ncbi:MAG: hypothetical protein QGH40_09075 [bacterium]|nr:hypothetical protein [bacterium]
MNSSAHVTGKSSGMRHIVIVGCALFVTLAVFNCAWVSEDSFITFRYVSNTLNGYGAVFNAEEYVQGYTHPLWFILLVVGCAIVSDPIFVAIGYGLICTFLTVMLLGYTLYRLTKHTTGSIVLLALASISWSLSDPWLSFQTSGLENSLSHLLITLILIETCVQTISRPARLTLLICLLCLNRPDFLFLILPIGVFMVGRIRSFRTAGTMALAALPAVAWLLFAWTYYHHVIPNTAYAKVGIYSNWIAASTQGFAYLGDWGVYDTVAMGCTVLFLTIAPILFRSKYTILCIAGTILYSTWVVYVGGDFMRGRMMTAVFNTAVVLGIIAIAMKMRDTNRVPIAYTFLVGGVITGLIVVRLFIPDPGARIKENGIINERKCYPGYHLSSYIELGQLINPYMDLSFANALRSYAEKCGPVTIHHRNPGTIGYLAGPKVSIIDTLGLTDAYIARLPRHFLVSTHPRPGHPDKYIPIAYLAAREDIAILPGWEIAVMNGDCSLTAKLEQYKKNTGFLRPY